MTEVEFLKQLHGDLTATFGDELGTALLGAAASEFFAGPRGVTAMFEATRQRGKEIPEHLRRIPKK